MLFHINHQIKLMKVLYTYSVKDNNDIILCTFWLLTLNEKLIIWSSLPYSVFNHKKDELISEPLPWDNIEQALTMLHIIVDWAAENDYHKRFAFHLSITEKHRESFTYSLDYRAIYHHPAIILCSTEINNYHFHRYKQEYDANMLFCPNSFLEETEPTDRTQFETFINQGKVADKEWYVENYNELSSFFILIDEEMISVFGFNSDELLAVVFNKTRWMD